jgi:hypothetical protein
MKMFKDDRSHYINRKLSITISLESALKEIEKFPTIAQYRNGLIGFINENNDIIQFFRYEPDDWLIDVPLLKATKPPYALQDEPLTTDQVKKVVTNFFKNQNWKAHLHLKGS